MKSLGKTDDSYALDCAEAIETYSCGDPLPYYEKLPREAEGKLVSL